MNPSKIKFAFTAAILLVAAPLFAEDIGGGGDTPPAEGSPEVVRPQVGNLTTFGGSNATGPTPQIDEFSGAVTYSIDIPVPPARGSIQPSVSLNYNSHRRNPNSWVGYGWELDMGSISRTPERGQVDYVAGRAFDVRFAGSGESITCQSEPLDPSEIANYEIDPSGLIDVVRCRPRIETAFNEYLKIRRNVTSFLVVQEEVTTWQVYDKSGIRYEFGNDNSSREEGAALLTEEEGIVLGPSPIARWMLRRVVDLNGNTLEVDYDNDHLPAAIRYVDQGITIRFNKSGGVSTPKNYFPIYRQTYLNREQMGVLLNDITIEDRGTRLMNYHLSYAPAIRSQATQLVSITPSGRTDTNMLPSSVLQYYQGADMHFDPVGFRALAGAEGYIGNRFQIVDMNGDGLPDKLQSFDDTWNMELSLNNGNGFEVPRTITDPFMNAQCPDNDCFGNIQTTSGENLSLYLTDMNGDGLPDRVIRIYANVSRRSALFRIAFNMGGRWSANWIDWADPYYGIGAGELGNTVSLIDMNGDGLPDRVAGNPTEGNFSVYLNNGNGFNSEAQIWQDPAAVADPNYSGKGMINDRGPQMHIFIRDMNGDGLPDRVWRGQVYSFDSSNNATPRIAFIVALNKNGREWAQPQLTGGPLPRPEYLYNGIDVLAIVDPIQEGDHDRHGTLDTYLDWMDFNNDGYLDRIEGDRTTGVFRVYFFQGIQWGSVVAELSAPTTITDPLSPNDPNGDGSGDLRHNWERRTTVAFMDLNGDGYPDRVFNTVRRGNEQARNGNLLSIHYFRTDSTMISYPSANPNRPNREINQPTNLLKRMSSKLSQQIFLSDSLLEYSPSSLTGTDGRTLHRFLPYSINLPRNIYTFDANQGAGSLTDEFVDKDNYQLTTYTFRGGNHFVRYAQENGPPEDEKASISSFNGFQEITKDVYSTNSNGTVDDLKTISYYHQAYGAIGDGYNAYLSLNPQGFGHYALSGKMFNRDIVFNGRPMVSEKSNWSLANPSSFTDEVYYCDGICLPQQKGQIKQVWELGSTRSRTSELAFDYDAYGNVSKKVDLDGNGGEILTSETAFYAPDEVPGLPRYVKDRPREQFQSKNGQKYRDKFFEYDGRGNPTAERFEYLDRNGSQSSASISRQFNPNGTLSQITDMDGITKQYRYDRELEIFPVREITLNPGGSNLTAVREYNRLNGQIEREVDPAGVGTGTIFDDFGRPQTEWVASRNEPENRRVLKNYAYAYVPTSIKRWNNLAVVSNRVFEIQPGYPSSATTPATISYLDGLGQTLQQCVLAENGHYREIFKQTKDGGKEVRQSMPRFSPDCAFVSDSDSLTGVQWTAVEQDFFGRPTRKTFPGGDGAFSPVNDQAYSYLIAVNGNQIRRTHLPRNPALFQEEEFDSTERLVRRRDPDGNQWTYEYDPVGDLRFVRQGSQALTEIQYDGLGRKIATIDSNLGRWEYYYDSNGRLAHQIDAKGQRIEFSYDAIGRTQSKRFKRSNGSLERAETYFYDRGDAEHSVESGELYQVEERDGATNNLLRTTLFGYDDDYRRTRHITRSIPGVADFTQTVTNDYLGRVTETVYPGAESVFYQYDSTGGLASICSRADCDASQGDIYYHLDPNSARNADGALLEEQYGNGVRTRYEYYANSRRLRQKTIQRGTDTYVDRAYAYDAHSNITAITDQLLTSGYGSGSVFATIYDNHDRLTNFSSGRFSGAVYTYAPNGNILQNTASFPNRTYEYTDPAHPHAVTRIGNDQYDYDANGNMIRDPQRDRMVYDAANRLVRVEMKNGTAVDYDYDYTGARFSKKTTGANPNGQSAQATTYYLGDSLEIRGDQIQFHLYAKDSRIATKALGTIQELTGASGAALIDRGIRPQMNFAMSVPYLLVFLGLFWMASLRRIEMPGRLWEYREAYGSCGLYRSRAFVLRRATHWLLAWRSYTHACSEALSVLRFRLGVKLVSIALMLLFFCQIPLVSMAANSGNIQSSGNDSRYFYYIHGDHLGSSNLMTEGKAGSRHMGVTYLKGDLLQRFEYAPFGQEQYSLNPNLKFDPSYTGQTYDIETGLYYYKARYYNPLIGRFIQPDTVVPDAKNLQAFNRYAYVINNPLKYSDPSGHSFFSWFRKLLGAFIGALISVLSFGALAPAGVALASLSFAQVVVFGALSGLAGGIVGGAITGGIRGALMGGVFGFIGGAVFGAANFGLSAAIGQIGAKVIMTGVGVGLSAGTGGWKGLATFGAGVLGGLAGKGLMGAFKGSEEKSATTAGGATKKGIGTTRAASKVAVKAAEQATDTNSSGHAPPDTSDGLSLDEANDWYQNGNGKTLTVNAGKISVLRIGGWEDNRAPGLVLGKDYSVYGNVTISHRLNGTYGIFEDTYDFDMKPWLGNTLRNIGTIIGSQYAGSGTPYQIRFEGNTNVINP